MEFKEVKRVRTLGLDSIPYSEKTGRTNLTWRQLIDKHKIIPSIKRLAVILILHLIFQRCRCLLWHSVFLSALSWHLCTSGGSSYLSLFSPYIFIFFLLNFKINRLEVEITWFIVIFSSKTPGSALVL